MKTVQQVIDATLKIENHDERYLYGRFKGFLPRQQVHRFSNGDATPDLRRLP
jgi:hypothetical protein